MPRTTTRLAKEAIFKCDAPADPVFIHDRKPSNTSIRDREPLYQQPNRHTSLAEWRNMRAQVNRTAVVSRENLVFAVSERLWESSCINVIMKRQPGIVQSL
jgi:hypothetical protein